jgi:hypothetical protein
MLHNQYSIFSLKIDAVDFALPAPKLEKNLQNFVSLFKKGNK